MRKLLIADGIEESRLALEALLQNRCEVRSCADGETALELLRQFQPDILVMDLMLPKTDGLSMLQMLRQWEMRPMVLVQTSLNSPYVMERLQRLEVDYVVVRPCQTQVLEMHIQDFLAQMKGAVPQRPSGDRMIAGILLSLSFSPKLDGYTYLLDAIPRYAQDPTQAITKELYAAVGQPWRKEAALVERSIRSAIDKAFREGDPEVWRRYFRCPANGVMSRPSNGAFIACMAQLLAGQMPRIIAL